MENEIVSTTNAVLDKKIGDYRFANENFVAPQELTVTITLAEYRDLVGKVATRDADIDKANTDKWKREDENKKLRDEIANLKEKLYELQNNMNSAKEEKSDE